MQFYERLIHFQNQAERDFENQKSLKNTFVYILAFLTFMASSIFAGFTMPFRKLARWIVGTKAKADAGGIVDVSGENIDVVLSENQLVLLDFWADWCGPCLLMNDTLKAFSQSESGVLIGKIDADKNAEILKKYKVKGLPQFLLIEDGKEVRRHAGAMTIVELEQFVVKKQ